MASETLTTASYKQEYAITLIKTIIMIVIKIIITIIIIKITLIITMIIIIRVIRMLGEKFFLKKKFK